MKTYLYILITYAIAGFLFYGMVSSAVESALDTGSDKIESALSNYNL